MRAICRFLPNVVFRTQCTEIGLAPTLIVDCEGVTWNSHRMPAGEGERVRKKYDELQRYFHSFERDAADDRLCDYLESIGRIIR